jgi:hypothetical protein
MREFLVTAALLAGAGAAEWFLHMAGSAASYLPVVAPVILWRSRYLGGRARYTAAGMAGVAADAVFALPFGTHLFLFLALECGYDLMREISFPQESLLLEWVKMGILLAIFSLLVVPVSSFFAFLILI